MFAFIYMWWFWVAMSLFLLLPIGYGWGYRGWGAPYPRYIQRRRMQRGGIPGVAATFDHQAWGRGGDFIWGLSIGAVVLVMVALFWR